MTFFLVLTDSIPAHPARILQPITGEGAPFAFVAKAGARLINWMAIRK